MRRPLWLIAGWAHAASSLEPLARALADDFDASLFALPDFGADPTGWPAALAGRIAAAPLPPVVAGWSLGGMVALAALQREPAPPARALVLIASTARFCAAPDHPCGVPERNLRALALALRRDPRAAVEGFLRDAALPAAAEVSEVRKRADEAVATGPALAAGLAFLQSADLRGGCARVRLPTLLLHGGADRVIAPESSQRLHGAIPSSCLAMLKDAGHDLPIRHAAWAAAQIVRWMKPE